LDFRRLIALFLSNRNICINNGEATKKLHNNIVFQEIDIFRREGMGGIKKEQGVSVT
jgi:hypothetical protein